MISVVHLATDSIVHYSNCICYYVQDLLPNMAFTYDISLHIFHFDTTIYVFLSIIFHEVVKFHNICCKSAVHISDLYYVA